MADLEVTCPCGKNFRRKAAYDRHMEVAHSETVSHKCKICGKTFGNSNTLTMHMSVHETKQNFAKLVRTRKGVKAAAEKAEENKNVLNKSAESEDSSSEKENSECQTSPTTTTKSIVTSDSSATSKHDTEQSVLSEKTTEKNSAKKKAEAAPSPEVVVVKSAPLPSLKEIIDSQSSMATTTPGSAKVSSNSSRENSTMPKSSSKSKDTVVSHSVSSSVQDIPKSDTSKIPVTVNILQRVTSQVQDKDNSSVISGSPHVEIANEPGAACPAQVTCKPHPAPGQGVVAPLPSSAATIPATPKMTIPRNLSTTTASAAAASTTTAAVATNKAVSITTKGPSSVTSSHPAFAAILSAPPAATPLGPMPATPATESSLEVASAVSALVAEQSSAQLDQEKLYTVEKGEMQHIAVLDESDDKLVEEDFDFITDEDLEELDDDDDDDAEDIDGTRKESRRSKRRRSENQIWKSLLTGKVYEEILNNLEGTPPKKARKDLNEQDATTFLTSQEMEDLPVKVEAIPQIDCIKTEPFDPDFPDLDQLEAAASLESPTGSSEQSAVSPTSVNPKMELTEVQTSDLTKRHFQHPGMSDKRTKTQSFDCFVCGKSFNSEKYLTMHISLHGTVKNADELLMPEPDSPDSSTIPSPVPKQIPEVNAQMHLGFTTKQLTQASLTPHQQLTQQVAALQQQSRQLQEQSALLQQQLQQQKTKTNVKKSPPAINRIVSEGGGWSCTLCNKTFAHNSGYKNHMRTHSNERPYVCTICDIGFKEKYHLKKHNLFIHSSELPEKCRFCGKRFKDSTAVRAHERIHSDERPFACRRCTKTFKTSECLWHHEHRSKTCGQALGDIIAKERAQRKRRKFPKSEPEEPTKSESNLRIKQEPGTVEINNQNLMGVNQNNSTSSAAAITAANAAIERNVQAIMMAEQRKAKENQMQKEILMKIPECVIKMEQQEVPPPSPSCNSALQPQTFTIANGMIPAPNKATSNFVVPPVSKNHPNQTVINMLSQPPRPVQPPQPPPMVQTAPPQTQIPTGRPIMSTMVKPVQHVQPQQQLQIISQQQQKQLLQQPLTTQPQPTQQQQQPRPLQQHPAQVVLPQQQKPQTDQIPPTIRPQPPQAVVQPQPRLQQPSNSTTQQQQQSQSSGRNKDFTCKPCNKSFKDVSSFQRHCKIHTEERPFICERCDIGFKMKVHLKKHNLYLHSDAYPCECQHCGKRFKDSSAVRLHERTHSDSRPFQCDGCQKAFKTRENLWGHQHRGKCMATKNKPGIGKECFNGKPPMSAHATVNDHNVAAHASVADDQVTAQAYVSTSQITAQAIIQNNQVTAHAMFKNSRVTAHASIVNNKLHAQAYVTDHSDPNGSKSVNVKVEKPETESSSSSGVKQQPQSKQEKIADILKVAKSTNTSPNTTKATTTAASPATSPPTDIKDNCYSLEDPQQALDASVLTSQMRAAISSTPVASIDDDDDDASPPATPLATSSPAAAIKANSVNLHATDLSSLVSQAPPTVAVSTDSSPTGTPCQTSPSAKWPTLKEFLAKGVTGTTMSPPAQVTNWFNGTDQPNQGGKKAPQNNNTKTSTANDYPTIKERLMGDFCANIAAGVVAQPRQQTTVGMVTRPHHPPPPPGIPRIIPGPPPPYPGTNKISPPPPPYPAAKSPSSVPVTSSPAAMEIAGILSTSPGGGGAIPSFQSTFLSKRTPPLPPISSLGSSPVMMRGEDPSIPIVYWDEDSSEKESQGSHWHGSGASESSSDSMFHDMSLTEKMLTQL